MTIENKTDYNAFETETQNQMREYKELRKTLRKYWRKLVKEGLKKAKERGLEIIVSNNSTFVGSENQIVVYDRVNEFDASNLINLSRPEQIDLYLKYHLGLERFKQLKVKLKKSHNFLSSLE